MVSDLDKVVSAGNGYRLVLLDFDGTLCLGDDPVLSYAQCVNEALAERYASNDGQYIRHDDDDFSVREAVRRGVDAGNLNVGEIRFDEHGYPEDIGGRADMVV